MSRLPDWRLRFDAYVTSRMRMPMIWGRNDCVLFAAGAVRSITGIDLARGMRRHRTALQAARVLRQAGGLEAVVANALGDAACAVADAVQGDVLLVRQGGRQLLAVCFDATHALAPTGAGLGRLPRSLAIRAWRVG